MSQGQNPLAHMQDPRAQIARGEGVDPSDPTQGDSVEAQTYRGTSRALFDGWNMLQEAESGDEGGEDKGSKGKPSEEMLAQVARPGFEQENLMSQGQDRTDMGGLGPIAGDPGPEGFRARRPGFTGPGYGELASQQPERGTPENPIRPGGQYTHDKVVDRERKLLAQEQGVHVETKQEYKDLAGVKEPRWWQKILLGAAAGGPEAARANWQAGVDRGYQEHIQGAMQERADFAAQRGLEESTRPENVQRIPYQLFGKHYELAEGQIGYVAAAQQRFLEFEKAGKSDVPLQDILGKTMPNGLPVPDRNVPLADATALLQLHTEMTAGGDHGDFVDAYIHEITKPPEEQDQLLIKLLFPWMQREMESKKPRMTDRELQEADPVGWNKMQEDKAYAIEMGKNRATKDQHYPYTVAQEPIDGVKFAAEIEALVAGYGEDVGPISRDILGLGSPPGSAQNHDLYGQNRAIMNRLAQPKFQQAAEEMMKNEGLYFKGRRFRPKTIKQMYGDFIRQLDKAIEDSEKMGYSGEAFTEVDKTRFMTTYFGRQHAEEKDSQRERAQTPGAIQRSRGGPILLPQTSPATGKAGEEHYQDGKKPPEEVSMSQIRKFANDYGIRLKEAIAQAKLDGYVIIED